MSRAQFRRYSNKLFNLINLNQFDRYKNILQMKILSPSEDVNMQSPVESNTNMTKQSFKEFQHRYKHFTEDYISILGDHQESNPIRPDNEFSFSKYADAIVKMIKGSDQQLVAHKL